MAKVDWEKNIHSASQRIRQYIERTPLVESPLISEKLGARVLLKLENQQVTGSFKARGAMNKLLCLTTEQRKNGVIAASSGNHGAAVAYGSTRLGCPATIYVPKYAAQVKKDAIRELGAIVIVAGDDCVETEAIARAASEASGRPYIPPYNDDVVMAGQGTVAVEMLEDCPELDAIFVALGGGGLIGGMGLYAKAHTPELSIVACSPEQSPALHRCMEAGQTIDVPCFETLSDATAGGVEAGSITVEVCRNVVDHSVLISEDQIGDCMRSLWNSNALIVEGAAGVALAGAEVLADQYQGKTLGIVICGGNIGEETRRQVLGF